MLKQPFVRYLLALVMLALFPSACALPSRPVSKPSGTLVLSRTPEPVSSTLLAKTLVPGYPVPEIFPGTSVFDGQKAYPAAEMTATAEAWSETLAALPTFIVVTITPAPPIAPESGSLDNPLPAPLYFILPSGGVDALVNQIWRMERDGFALTQISNEEHGVGDRFDVAADGRLAYVSNNSLIITDASGGNRKVIIAGAAPVPPQDQGAWFSDKEEILIASLVTGWVKNRILERRGKLS